MNIALRDGVSTADTEYGIALLDRHSGDYWELNPTGATVLRTLLAGGSPEKAVDEIIARYAVDRDTAQRDVEELVDGLRAVGLMVDAEGAR